MRSASYLSEVSCVSLEIRSVVGAALEVLFESDDLVAYPAPLYLYPAVFRYGGEVVGQAVPTPIISDHWLEPCGRIIDHGYSSEARISSSRSRSRSTLSLLSCWLPN